MSVSLFLPVRKGSERVLEKNTRPFAQHPGGLLEVKLRQLRYVRSVQEIIVSTNDPRCVEVAKQMQEEDIRIKIDRRPQELCTSHTSLIDVIEHASKVCAGNHILWTHVTSPLFDSDLYEQGIALYKEKQKEGFDSVISGRKYQDYLLDIRGGNLVNSQSDKAWPRTQDLRELFEVNNAIFLTSRTFFEKGRRVGNKAFLWENGKIPSLDIDDEEDFSLAEIVYERIIG